MLRERFRAVIAAAIEQRARLVWADVIAQTWWRGVMARHLYAALVQHRHELCTHIQSCWRRHVLMARWNHQYVRLKEDKMRRRLVTELCGKAVANVLEKARKAHNRMMAKQRMSLLKRATNFAAKVQSAGEEAALKRAEVGSNLARHCLHGLLPSRPQNEPAPSLIASLTA